MWKARRCTGCLNRINQRRLWQELDADVNKLLLQRRKSNNWNSVKVFILPINSSVLTICSQKQKRRGLLYLTILKMYSCWHIYKLKWKSSHKFEKYESFLELVKKTKKSGYRWRSGGRRDGAVGKEVRQGGKEVRLVKICLARRATVRLWTTTFLCPESHSFKSGKKHFKTNQ